MSDTENPPVERAHVFDGGVLLRLRADQAGALLSLLLASDIREPLRHELEVKLCHVLASLESARA